MNESRAGHAGRPNSEEQSMQKPLEPGTLVRAKVRTMFGWKGLGLVKYDDGRGGVLIDKLPLDPDSLSNTADFRRHELAVVRGRRNV